VNSSLAHLSCRATVAHEPADAAAFGHAFMEVATGLGLRPGRMITTGKGRKLDAKAFASDLSDRSVEHVAVWNDKADEGARAHLYVRDGDHPGIDEFTDRATELIVPVSAVDTIMACLGILDRHFGLVSANVAAHRDYGYAWKEAVRRGVPGTWDAATVERIQWDAAHWIDARTKLIRLSPITVIGPSHLGHAAADAGVRPDAARRPTSATARCSRRGRRCASRATRRFSAARATCARGCGPTRSRTQPTTSTAIRRLPDGSRDA
jgi:hypothetical protein